MSQKAPPPVQGTFPSCVYGPTQPPLRTWTIGDVLQRQAREYPYHEALICGNTSTRITYSQLDDRTRRLGDALIASGIGPGDRIGIFAGNVAEYVEIVLATARIGGIAVLFNTFFSTEEIERALRFTGCAFLFICDSLGQRSLRPCIIHLQHIMQMQSDDLPEFRQTILLSDNDLGFSNLQTYEAFLSGSVQFSRDKNETVEDQVTKNTVCIFQFTSGTTGVPKTVMLTHFNVINNGFLIGDRIGLTSDDTICCPWPLFHSSGLVVGLMTSLLYGSTLVLPSPTFDPGETARALVSEKCTGLQGVPTMFAAVLAWYHQQGAQLPALRTGIIGGSPVSPSLLKTLHESFGLRDLGIAYGMTETSPLSYLSKGLQSDERHTWMDILPHTSAKVVDTHGKTVPVGTPGELCIAGYLLQQGYYQNLEKTREVMRLHDNDGLVWMHTGDEAIMNEKGQCRISGRIKDIIIRGGENIYPTEIEDRLNDHPAISMSAVVGIKDRRYGEIVAAFLQLHHGRKAPTTTEISEWVQLVLGKQKAPALIFYLGVDNVPDEFPKTASGKIKKADLVAIGNRLVHNKNKL
ncbi:hypothetical protein BDV34DRAFT_61211 [Aspergillus parasiticus]|uniref:AMP-binding enzyme n=1 Tax=Aspergillus parasiticus TaxID=5067 RepID=A0A5N6D0Z9_ASPPA|nr:hypothetical protein BDV34DRAFT_61211 [Aspergillus parasiticus]